MHFDNALVSRKLEDMLTCLVQAFYEATERSLQWLEISHKVRSSRGPHVQAHVLGD